MKHNGVLTQSKRETKGMKKEINISFYTMGILMASKSFFASHSYSNHQVENIYICICVCARARARNKA